MVLNGGVPFPKMVSVQALSQPRAFSTRGSKGILDVEGEEARTGTALRTSSRQRVSKNAIDFLICVHICVRMLYLPLTSLKNFRGKIGKNNVLDLECAVGCSESF